MKKKCQHLVISRGIEFTTGKFYSFCEECGKKWFDGGKKYLKRKEVRNDKVNMSLLWDRN